MPLMLVLCLVSNNKILQVRFEEGGESYDVFLQLNNWTNCFIASNNAVLVAIVKYEGEFVISIIFVCKYFSNLIS